jgi:hypothetical protein
MKTFFKKMKIVVDICFEMTYITNIRNGKEPPMTQNQILFAQIGRKLMEISEGTSMKGLTDDQIARTNRMSSFGDALTRFGASFGPRTLKELLELAGVSLEEAQEFMALGK